MCDFKARYRQSGNMELRQLQFNISKCLMISITRTRNLSHYDYNVVIVLMRRVTEVKDLGVGIIYRRINVSRVYC